MTQYHFQKEKIPQTIVEERFEEATILFNSLPTLTPIEIDDILDKVGNKPEENTQIKRYILSEVRIEITINKYYHINEKITIQSNT